MTAYKKAFLLVLSALFLAALVALTALAIGGNLSEADQIASIVGALASLAALAVSVWQLMPSAPTNVRAVNGTAVGGNATRLSGVENEVRGRRGRAPAGGSISARDGMAVGGDMIEIQGDKNVVT
ncbi:hypothetical protein [Streptomyces sp. NPDC088254]|uniref:hypothetical protein n=1 Tax=Streptomyces sp. NPDC088254 TaxID=3365847 RepID=UPI0037FE21AE